MQRRLVSAAAAAGLLAASAGVGAGVASDPAPRSSATPSVRVVPSVVQRGNRITVTGRNWPRNVIVELLIGPPRSEAEPVGRARTTSTGAFRRYLRIASTTAPGRWVLLGCRRECRVKAVRSFRVISRSGSAPSRPQATAAPSAHETMRPPAPHAPADPDTVGDRGPFRAAAR